MVKTLMISEAGARASISARPKPRVPLESSPGILPVGRSRLALVGMVVVNHQIEYESTGKRRSDFWIRFRGSTVALRGGEI